jgi:GntR family transcriptional regulator
MSASERVDPGRLLKEAPQKLYLQVAEVLRTEIRAGSWEVGARLPSLEALAQRFRVAVITVRQAIALLEKEGMLRREHGRGTFVADDLRRHDIWLRMDSRWTTLVEKWAGIRPRVLAVKERVACPKLADLPGSPAACYHYMRRVHATQSLPYALVEIYLEQSLYERAPKRFAARRVLEVLQAIGGVSVAKATETLTIGAANLETAHHLQMPLNSPVGVVRRALVDRSGVLIYLAHLVYRADVVRIERSLSAD